MIEWATLMHRLRNRKRKPKGGAACGGLPVAPDNPGGLSGGAEAPLD